MIKIISGVYGRRNINGVLEKMTSKSDPFELSPVEEERLVKRKVAVYVDNVPLTQTDDADDLTQNIDIKKLKLMSRPQLEAIALQQGVADPSVMGNKNDIINAIAETMKDDEQLTDEQPNINADNTIIGG